jgi:methyl coenzyme M reductase subunit C
MKGNTMEDENSIKVMKYDPKTKEYIITLESPSVKKKLTDIVPQKRINEIIKQQKGSSGG